MSSEDYEVFKVLREEKRKQGVERRTANNELFNDAVQLAAQSGMVLLQHSEVHYSLYGSEGWPESEWILHIYPGNRRLYRDAGKIKGGKQRPKPPFIKVKPDWNLLDVIQTMVAALRNTDSFEKEIAKNITSEIQVRAYFLWVAANRPEGDGQQFWLQAEAELKANHE